MSKCEFGVIEVEYFGYFIFEKGVVIDFRKVVVMKEWLCFKIVKELRGFFGFIG